MSKITLTNVVNLQDTTTAQTTINNNNAIIQAAFDNTLSRDGTSPNQLTNNVDANSNRILNLPQPATSQEPLRLQDLSSFTGGGIVTNIPAGGNTGDALVKNSNTNYDTKWSADSNTVSAGTNIAVTGTSPAIVSTITSPVFTGVNLTGLTVSQSVQTDASKNLISLVNTGSGNNVLSTSPTLVTPVLGTPTSGTLTNCTGLPVSTLTGTGTGVLTALAANVTGSTGIVLATSPTLVTPVLGTPTSGTLTSCTGLPISTGVSGLAANVATFLGTPSSANLLAALTDKTGTGTNVFATSPTITTPAIVGITSGSNPSAGNVGEVLSQVILQGSAVSLTSGIPANIATITLTAGIWDLSAQPAYDGNTTTTVTGVRSSLSTTSATENNVAPFFISTSFSSFTLFVTFDWAGSISPIRVAVSGSTQYWLVSRAQFAVSTCAGYGSIRAVRVA